MSNRIALKTFLTILSLLIISLVPGESLGLENTDKTNEKPSDYETASLKQNSKEPPYEINCRFPVFKAKDGGSGFDPAELNKKIKKLIKERATESSNGFQNREYRHGQSSYLEIGFEVFRPNSKIVSILFAMESYGAGAAHPIHWSESLVYDLEGNRVLKLSTILNNAPRYLEMVSKTCIADLKAQKGLSDDQWIEEGAGPKAKNYRTFFLDKEGIGIIFDEYQVGPYVSGAYHCKIPYSKLKSFLNPSLKLGN